MPKKRNLNDKNATCPFFHHHTPTTITCEGLLVDTTDMITFGPSRSKKLHFELYCSYKPEECPRYQLLMKKYEEE